MNYVMLLKWVTGSKNSWTTLVVNKVSSLNKMTAHWWSDTGDRRGQVRASDSDSERYVDLLCCRRLRQWRVCWCLLRDRNKLERAIVCVCLNVLMFSLFSFLHFCSCSLRGRFSHVSQSRRHAKHVQPIRGVVNTVKRSSDKRCANWQSRRRRHHRVGKQSGNKKEQAHMTVESIPVAHHEAKCHRLSLKWRR